MAKIKTIKYEIIFTPEGFNRCRLQIKYEDGIHDLNGEATYSTLQKAKDIAEEIIKSSFKNYSYFNPIYPMPPEE
jgi:hypothetical protein